MELKNLMRHARDLRRSLANRKFEATDDGRIFLPEQKLLVGGIYGVRKNDDPWEFSHNLVVNEGLTYLLDVGIANGTKLSTWYLAPFSGNVTPLASWTAANFTANATEFTSYSEAARQTFVTPAAASQNVNNTASVAVITCNAAGPFTIYGAGLLSVSTKSATTGKLMSAGLFASPKSIDDTETLSTSYSLTATSS